MKPIPYTAGWLRIGQPASRRGRGFGAEPHDFGQKDPQISLKSPLLLLVGLAMIGPLMSNVEHPQYKVVSADKNIEVREYAPMIIAEVSIPGEREKAIGDGFRVLADYIFGNNTAQQDIAMTAPRQQQASENIAMTAPVQQQQVGQSWKVSFVMPSQYSMQTLPTPNDGRVKLVEVEPKRFIVIRFSGSNSSANIAEHEQKLLQYVLNNQVEPLAPPKYAFYNPPWTLPFLKRNEVMIEIGVGS